MEHGTHLMLRSGYTGTGLVELLEAAGVPKGSFYNHFDSKEAFAVELVRRYYDGHDRLLASLIAQTDRSPLERLRSYFEELRRRAAAASPQTRGCLLGMFAVEMAGSSEPLRQSVSDAFRRWQARVAELLRQAQTGGELDPERDLQPLAAMLLEGWEGALMRSRVSHDLDGLRNFIEVAFSRLLVPGQCSCGPAMSQNGASTSALAGSVGEPTMEESQCHTS
jgi:TetR/AcrR family transcriptional regulator, transcriptional repressor for nem operon